MNMSQVYVGLSFFKKLEVCCCVDQLRNKDRAAGVLVCVGLTKGLN